MKQLIKLFFVSIIGLSIVIMIGTRTTNAMDLSNNEVELENYPTEVGLSPKNVSRKANFYTVPFKFSFAGGTGTYHWSFSPGDGTPALSGTTTFYTHNLSWNYSLYSGQSKNTWYPYVNVLSTNRASDTGKVYLYR